MHKKVLVTGGAGYIGGVICSALADAGHHPVVLDSLVTGDAAFAERHQFYHGDVADEALIARVFDDHPEISCTIHCAALALVPDSVARPFDYYVNNVTGSLKLIRAVAKRGCRDFVFSSSASVYEAADGSMVTEESPVNPASPYARTKLMTEMMLADLAASLELRALSLRYFNPIGADPQMRSGQEDRESSQILGILVEVASGGRDVFRVTGTDWPTRDGTGIRDYVHVWDLARAHVLAVERMGDVFPTGQGYRVLNLGTGTGVTVREIVAAFERAHGSPIPQEDAPPRPGDVAGAFANADRAADLLGWSPELSLDDGIRHALEWAALRDSA